MTKYLLCVILAACSGCINLSKTVRELAKDPATVKLSVRSIYLTLDLERTAPRTNSMPHTIKDGSISVGKE